MGRRRDNLHAAAKELERLQVSVCVGRAGVGEVGQPDCQKRLHRQLKQLHVILTPFTCSSLSTCTSMNIGSVTKHEYINLCTLQVGTQNKTYTCRLQ